MVCFCRPSFEGRTESEIGRVMNTTNATIFFLQLLHDLACPVATAVIDQNEFNVSNLTGCLRGGFEDL